MFFLLFIPSSSFLLRFVSRRKRVNLREDAETVTGLPLTARYPRPLDDDGPEPRLSKYRRVIARVWNTGRPRMYCSTVLLILHSIGTTCTASVTRAHAHACKGPYQY